MKTEKRESGISLIGKIPWGIHLCLFYETEQDLLDVLVPYFKAGLESHECCAWVITEPLTMTRAKHALRQVVPDLDRHLSERNIQIMTHAEFYLKDGVFDLHRVIASWNEKLAAALARGYAGLRVSGNTAWIQEKDWRDFREYEKELNVAVTNRRLLVLCTYHLAATGAAEVLDVTHSHQQSLALRRGVWEIIEAPALSEAKAEIKRLNEQLERRIAERTRELEAANKELREEIAERKRAEEQIRQYAVLLQTLSNQLLIAQEAERRAIARELHDEIGQALTAAKINLQSISQRTAVASETPLIETIGIIDKVIQQVRSLSLDLRPSMLDDLGLVPALRWYIDHQAQLGGFIARFSAEALDVPVPPEVQTACFRVAQGALTNVIKHAQAKHVVVELRQLHSSEGSYFLELVVQDDGRGFDSAAAFENAERGGSMGLLNMRDRAQLLGGQFEIVSSPNSGTVVRATFPLKGNSS